MNRYKDKFIDDIRKHVDTKESSIQEIIGFLQTLGVDAFPKRKNKKIRPDKDYKLKLLEGLYFPFTIEGTTFKDAKNMESRVYDITSDVTVIEELEEILKNCETQHIIEWIKADSILSQILFTRREMSSSRVEIIWDLKRDYRYLPLDNIYAYIYWLFETIAWIKIGNKRFKISDCLLSKIGNSLEPLLVEPDIDIYIKDIDGSKSRIRSEYEYILGKIGVENDFSELPIENIFKVLNHLPGIDNSEAIAKRFYGVLVKSDRVISDAELQCKPFEQFIESGMVLCNTGYQRIQDSWYLDGKNICEKIANNYNLIEIPKRQSSTKIKRLLGVDKLSLKGEVVGTPETHPENMTFQRDFNLYKPMAFCYRLDNATKDEAKRFSELEIILCLNLTARYTDKEIELDDYDFILKDSKCFYLKVPRTLKSLDEMKRNVSFAAAIANVMCSFIDVTESFASFRELYGANDSSRKELINQIFEDNEILERAKIELNYSEDTKEEFIRITANCSGENDIDIAELVSDIDFDNFLAISNARLIIDCFKKLSIDIGDYNSGMPTTQIDLYNYYQSEISRLKPKYENLYKLHHFQRLKQKSLEEKKKLVDLFLNYEYIQPKIGNSVQYDCETELLSCLGIQKDIEEMDLVSLYNKNRASWEKELENVQFVNEFLNNPTNMSCVYYGEYDELNKKYEEFRSSLITEEEELESEDGEDTEPVVLHPTTTPAPQNATYNGENGKKSTGFSTPKNLEKIGFKGERFVYEMLNKQYTSVKWVSESAKSANVNPEGRAGLGYDIEYIDANGNRIYVEVKSSKTDEIVFYMSENEFDFAIKNIDKYCIYYVCGVASKKPKILVLDNLFKGNDFNSDNYALNRKAEYKVTANII